MNKQTWAFKKRANFSHLLGRAMRYAVLSVVMLAGFVPLLAQAENSIQAITGAIQGGAEVVQIGRAHV